MTKKLDVNPYEVVHTIGSLSATMGGPSRTVPRLCAALCEQSLWRPRIVTAKAPLADIGIPVLQGTGLTFVRAISASASLDRPRIVHDHGAWRGNNLLAALAARSAQAPLIISPRGMLEPWALSHGRSKKRLAMWTYQRRLLSWAQGFHATSEDEAVNLRRLGLRQPVAVIPNGVDVPDALPQLRSTRRRVLFLSRLNVKKGILPLLEVWRQLRPVGWELLIAGPDEGGYRTTVVDAVAALGLSDTVQLHPEVEDAAKWRLYASASLFVLPTFSENFGMVVAESLAAGVPVVTTTGTPWQGLVSHECGWWVEPKIDPLRAALAHALSMDDSTLAAMGANGRSWMQSSFSWSAVGRHMGQFYDWLAAGAITAQAPCFVQV